jgi:hypothetical protein
MIKNIQLKVSADPRGKIKSGMKNAKGLPQSLDYFNIDKFPDLQAAYGLKPSMLIVFFPTNNITDFFDCNYVLYGKETKIRSCDGERCIHRIDEEIGGTKYAAGEESECTCLKHKIGDKDKKRCKYHAYFKAYIALPQTGKVDSPMCFLFETGSHNTGENVLSELEKIRVLNNGVLLGVPFALSVKMVSGKESAKTKFPIWTLTPIGLLSEIRKRADQFSLAPIQGQFLLDSPKTVAAEVVEDEKGKKMLKEVQAAKDRAALKGLFDKVSKMLTKKEISDDEFSKIRDGLNQRWTEVK